MQFDFNYLRGVIKGKNYTERDFAKEIGMVRQTLSNKLNNKVPFTQEEMYKIKNKLNLNTQNFMKCFFKDVI